MLLLAGLAGCSGGGSSSAPGTAASSSSSPPATVPAGTLQAPGLAAGQAWTSPVGDRATYYSSSVSGNRTAVDAGFCAASGGGMAADVSSYSWVLVAADGTEYRPSSNPHAAPSPLYPDTKLVEAGGCLRGWIAFSVPSGTHVARVGYQPQGTPAPLATWIP